MALKPIIFHPNSLLSKPSIKVEKFDQELQILVNDLVDTMLENKSMGLAAPQIGELKRVFVLNQKRILYQFNMKLHRKELLK